ncbi:Amino acid permease family protein [Prunus dulcis]|uniref:Amino acid permease family protein n=1 Tax=Prunus dulcis TaxID=3755 RepID=A0A4Y1RJ92_PRUDU|nr:Amino acid permease family protein [Prunus dulcis]
MDRNICRYLRVSFAVLLFHFSPHPKMQSMRASEFSTSSQSLEQEQTESQPKITTKNPKKLAFLPLVFLIYFEVSGGPYGEESAVGAAGPLFAILGFLIFPFIWSIPEALVTAELATAYPATAALSFGHTKLLVPSGAPSWALGNFSVGLSQAVGLGIVSLCPFIIMSLVAIPKIDPSRWISLGQKGVKRDWTLFINTLFWNLNFWDNASTLAGEVEEPQKLYPKALFSAGILTCLGYVIPLLAATGAIPLDQEDWVDGLGMLLEFASFLWLRVKFPALKRPFEVPMGLPGLVVMCLIPSGFLVYVLAVATKAVYLVSALMTLFGVAWYLFMNLSKSKMWFDFKMEEEKLDNEERAQAVYDCVGI